MRKENYDCVAFSHGEGEGVGGGCSPPAQSVEAKLLALLECLQRKLLTIHRSESL